VLIPSRSRRVWRATQLRSEFQNLLDRRQRSARAAARDMRQVFTQPQAEQMGVRELSGVSTAREQKVALAKTITRLGACEKDHCHNNP
jgi:hypothetical protein